MLRGKEGTGKTKVGEVFGSLIARRWVGVTAKLGSEAGTSPDRMTFPRTYSIRKKGAPM